MDSYIYLIAVLLPVSSTVLLCQTNPYRALVIRGIVGAIAALIYTVLGAADVALTEALVGTLLSVMLTAVAVRSSLVFRLGVLQEEAERLEQDTDESYIPQFSQLINDFQQTFSQRHMKVELVPYRDQQSLSSALAAQEVHAICLPSLTLNVPNQDSLPPYQTITRLQRLYEILSTELISSLTRVMHSDSWKQEERVS